MTTRRPANRALNAILNQVWAMPQAVLEEMISIAERQNPSVEAVAAKLGRPLDNTERTTVRDGVAIVPVNGPLFRYANLFTDLSGATSIEMLALELRAAVDDPKVAGILLDIDSPGGEMSGINEFAAQVRAASGVKPLVAYVGSTGASAAYWIAAAAPTIVADRTAILGSIGVVATLSDDSKRREASGVRRFEFVSSQSPNKRPNPETEAGRATIQATVDRLAEEMIAAIADLRGTDAATVMERFGGGGVLVGADAVAAGMADRIGSFEEVLAELAAAGSTRRKLPSAAAAATTTETALMTEITTPAPAPAPAPVVTGNARTDITTETIARDHAAIADHFRAEGRQQEKDRLAGLRANSLPGFEALLAAAEADGKSTGAELSQRIVAAQRQAGTAALDSRRAAEAALAGVPAPAASSIGAATTAIDAAAPIEERAKAEWERDPKLRGEFGDLRRYAAFRKAEDSGRVRLLRKTG